MYKYLNNASPTGFESPGQQIWLDYMKPYSDEYIVDTYGSVAAVINPGQKYKVVIEAHADEIAWFVHYITKDGFIYLKRNGGSDHGGSRNGDSNYGKSRNGISSYGESRNGDSNYD